MLGNPFARTDDLVVQKSGNEHLIYDLRTNNAICLNQTSALVWEHCDGKRSVSDIAKELEKKLGLEVSEDLVLLAINQLANEGLLLGSEELAERFRGVSRREVIKKIGLASMVALPVISSLVAPTSANAQSCFGTGALPPGNLPAATPQPITACQTYCGGPCCAGFGSGTVTFGPGTPPLCTCDSVNCA